MGDRITKAVIGPYDQVVALTQYMINTGLQSQYDWAYSAGFVKPATIKLGNKYGNQGFYNALLGPSRIIVSYAPGDLSSCIYRMTITSGQLQIYTSKSDENENVTSFSLNNFRLACPVNMGLQGLDPNSADYKRIRSLMNKPGNYTIQQLLVDFQHAQTRVLDEATCDFGKWTNDDWILKDMHVAKPAADAKPTADYWRPDKWDVGQPRKLEEDMLFHLKTCFNAALTGKVTESNSGQLGFVANGESSGTGHEATFVPSDVRFQTYPWRDGNGATINGYEGNGRLNYLLYCEMVDGNTPPQPADATSILQPVGNWTNGSDPSKDPLQEFGSYYLAKRNFLDAWFIPRLKKVNRTMSCTYWQPSMSFSGNLAEWSATFNFSIVVGAGCQAYGVKDSEDDKYNMTSASSQPEKVTNMLSDIPDDAKNVAFSTLPTGALSWYYWNSPENPKTDWTQEDHDFGNRCDSEARARCCSRLSIVPGQNKMLLEGLTRLIFGYYVNPSIASNVDKTNRLTTTWKVEFTLKEIDDGGLAIAISDPEQKYFWQSLASGWKWASGPNAGKDYDIKADFEDRFDQAKTNLKNLVHEMQNSLQGNDKFYFPSRGRFFFKDPMFSHVGDLVAKCAYNGNETGTANPDGDTRDTSSMPDFEQIAAMMPGVNGSAGKNK
ncbi:hypothetical protein PVAG01_04588 [Phlyctema vagabunda]|uniref:Uncharacterized protein n=1 Tax=Phlyctema vagabunda TaxID=108571 RepID=A0ABR4PIM4_9HELO